MCRYITNGMPLPLTVLRVLLLQALNMVSNKHNKMVVSHHGSGLCVCTVVAQIVPGRAYRYVKSRTFYRQK